MQKYGGMLAYTGLILITGMMAFLIFDKVQDILSGLEKTMDIAREVMDLQSETLSGIDNIRGGGSGLVPA